MRGADGALYEGGFLPVGRGRRSALRHPLVGHYERCFAEVEEAVCAAREEEAAKVTKKQEDKGPTPEPPKELREPERKPQEDDNDRVELIKGVQDPEEKRKELQYAAVSALEALICALLRGWGFLREKAQVWQEQPEWEQLL